MHQHKLCITIHPVCLCVHFDCQEFERINIPGYQLVKLQDRYYLSLDQLAAVSGGQYLGNSWPREQFQDQLSAMSMSQISIDVPVAPDDGGVGETRIVLTPPSPERGNDPARAFCAGRREEDERSRIEEIENAVILLAIHADDVSDLEDRRGGEADATEGEGDRALSTEPATEEEDWVRREGGVRSADTDIDGSIRVPTKRETDATDLPENVPASRGDREEEEDDTNERTLTRSSARRILGQVENSDRARGDADGPENPDGVAVTPEGARRPDAPSVTEKTSSASVVDPERERSDSSLGFSVGGPSIETSLATVAVGRSVKILGHGEVAGAGEGVQEAPVACAADVASPPKESEEGKKDRTAVIRADIQGEDKTDVTEEDGTSKTEVEKEKDEDQLGKVKSGDDESGMDITTRGDLSMSSTPKKVGSATGPDCARRSATNVPPEFPLQQFAGDGTSPGRGGGRRRDTPRSQRTSSTGGTTISGPLSNQVSCNSLSGSLTECDEEGGSNTDYFCLINPIIII